MTATTPRSGNIERCSSTATNSNVYVEPAAVTTIPTAETESDEVLLEADKALLSAEQITSEADLYYAKMQYEERLKYALRYEFAFESPLTFVQRFFECAFSPAERKAPDSQIKKWEDFTICVIQNTTIFPLGRQFHPVYVAAAYLTWTRQAMNTQAALQQQEAADAKLFLPETIGGHPWFLFVDPAINPAELDFVYRVLDEDYKWMK